MPLELEDLSIGALAEASGVTVETIRFYQRKRLLRTPIRQSGQIRRYTSRDIARVKFVKASQRLGFSLQETAALLKLDDGKHCGEARDLAEQKLDDIRRQLVSLRQLEAALEDMVKHCRATNDGVRCPLIESLQETS